MNIRRSQPSFTLAACLLTLFVLDASGQEPTWYSRQSEWKGYPQYHFTVADRAAYIVTPKESAPGNPWIWRARFPGYHAEMDVELLGNGFHIAYVDVAGLFGAPKAIEIGDAFYEYLTTKRNLADKPALEGVSRGGLFVYNWAARNSDKVACIYCDTPVCDFKSWPGGKGDGVGAQKEWEQCKSVYGLNEEQAETYSNNPIDIANSLADATIPLLTIVSESDIVVPPKENTYLLQERLEQLGHQLEVISVAKGTEKSKGHHFKHPAPQRVVDFIARHGAVDTLATEADKRMQTLLKSKRVVLLGDSITYAGHHWAFFDTWLQTRSPRQRPELINVGLPSETVSGLSEEGHAGGRFPRPDLAERLDRVLATTKPDLVIACYGINCGIYQPFDQERFGRYQAGIRRLKSKVEEANAELILVTPPVFDGRQKSDFSYDDVMHRYSTWLLEQRQKKWAVIDLHGPMARALAERKKADPKFTFQPDGVHPNQDGYWFVASELIRAFGGESAAASATPEAMYQDRGISKEQFNAIRERMNVRRNAYLSTAGHKRPGVKPGLSIEEAEAKAQELSSLLE